MHLTKLKKRSWVHFLCKKAWRKDRRKKSVKKVLQKAKNYGILYVKLGANFAEDRRWLADC